MLSLADSDNSLCSWDFRFSRFLSQGEISEISTLIDIIKEFNPTPFPDSRIWIPTWSVFSCKSFFEVLTVENPYVLPFKKIWQFQVSLKIKFFLWTLLRKKVSTCDVVQRRKPWKLLCPQRCCLCCNSNESHDHLFFSCPFAKELWKEIWKIFRIIQPVPSNFLEWLSYSPQTVDNKFLSKEGMKLWWLATISLFWAIWIERKNRIFEDKVSICWEVWELAVFRASWWAKKDQDFSSIPVSELCRSCARAEELIKLLDDTHDQGTRLEAFAEKIICEYTLSDCCAIALSFVIVLVTSKVPDTMKYITFEFQRSCWFTDPGLISDYNEAFYQSFENYKKHLGYKESESEKDYLNRLRSNMKLYGAFLQREVQGIDTTGYGLAHGLDWLESLIYCDANIILIMAALKEFLYMSGFALYHKHGPVFRSSLRNILKFMENRMPKDLDVTNKPEYEDLSSDLSAVLKFIHEEIYLREPPQGWALEKSLLSSGYPLVRAGEVWKKNVQEFEEEAALCRPMLNSEKLNAGYRGFNSSKTEVQSAAKKPKTAVCTIKSDGKYNEDFNTYKREFDSWISQVMESSKNLTIESLSARAEELIKLLNDTRDQGTRLEVFAKKVVCECRLSYCCAIALSFVIALVTSKIPDTMKYIIIEFERSCKFTAPGLLSEYKAFYRPLENYRCLVFNEFESEMDYMQQLRSNMKLYGAFLQREVQGFNPFGYDLAHGGHGFEWLESMIFCPPRNSMVLIGLIAALKEFVYMSGFALYEKYGRIFISKLNEILECVSKINDPGFKNEAEYLATVTDLSAVHIFMAEEEYLTEPPGWALGKSFLDSSGINTN